MSDERLLGILPDDLSTVLLDWTVRQIDAAAASAANPAEFQERAAHIRAQARAIADAAAEAEDDTASLMVRLQRAQPAIAAGASLPAADASVDAGPGVACTDNRREASAHDETAVVPTTAAAPGQAATAATPTGPVTGTPPPIRHGAPRAYFDRVLRRLRGFLGGGSGR